MAQNPKTKPVKPAGHIMSPAELQQDMRQFGAKLAADPEAALRFLKQAGILNTSGKLAKAYK
jgi:hypothetical protein